MVNINKIKELAKEQGISITFVCNAVGQGPYYLNDVKRRGADIPDERLKIVADILHTTPEYLRDESEEKSPGGETLNKLADYFGVSVDYLLGKTAEPAPSLSEDEIKLRALISKMPPEQLKTAYIILSAIAEEK